MSPMWRLTLFSAVSAAALTATSAVFAQAGTAAGTAGAPPPRPPESGAVPERPRQGEERPPSAGCPYRDGKLELIV